MVVQLKLLTYSSWCELTLSNILEVGEGKKLFNTLLCQVLPEPWEQCRAQFILPCPKSKAP